MDTKDIKIGHLYYVDFEPVRPHEFNQKHLAVVLKKNADAITFVVIPLTSKERGLGTNKVDLGVISDLPDELSAVHSYAVIDQVRTVSASRFMRIKKDGMPIDVKLSEGPLKLIYRSVVKDFLRDVPDSMLRDILF